MLRSGSYLQNRYEILELIGSGGMADVYKARCHKLNRLVAIKVLKEEFSTDSGFVSRFKMEAQAAARLSHPNIVNIYDVVDDGNLHYIVMELIEGITLKNYIAKKGQLDIKEAVGISIQVAQGIAAAHEHQIIHRDIKPQNMIISKDGKVKVADFGIAKAATGQTTTMAAMGSVHYISPEQARGGYSDLRSDIYSLGITMYEMVTGRVPFAGDNTVAVALAHLEEPIVRPSVYNPAVPISLENIILKCTEKKPEYRYSSVTEVISDLKRSLIYPNEDFVAMTPDQDFGGETVTISNKELNAIKVGQKNYQPSYRSSQEDYHRADGYRADDYENYEASELPHNMEYSDREYQDRGYSDREYQERNYMNREYQERGYHGSKGSRNDVNPKIERIMTAVGIFVAILILALLIFVFVRLGGIFNLGSGSNPTTIQAEPVPSSEENTLSDTETYMPDVLNLHVDMAKAKLKEANLDMKILGYEDSDTVEKDYVLSQVIPEGTVVKKYDTVGVYVSNGSDLVDLSQIIMTGMDGESAKLVLEQYKLLAVLQPEYHDTIPEGQVIRCEPMQPREGDTVTLFVSAGSMADMRSVPELRNLTEEAAIGLLAAAELNPGTVTPQYDDTVPAGYIISQELEANTLVKAGTTVSYVVSLGPKEQRYTGSISTTFQLIAGSGSPAPLQANVMVRLKQDNNGEAVYTTLMDPRTITSDELLSIDYQDMEGIPGIDYGEVEVVNVEDGMVMQSYPVGFSQAE